MNQDDAIKLSIPPERPSLEPFATAFLEEVVPQAVRGGWFEAGQSPPVGALRRISRRIEDQLKLQIGHPCHPAIYVHALLVCTHFFYQTAQDVEDPDEQERQTAAIDAAFSLVQSLELHHGLYELYLRLR